MSDHEVARTSRAQFGFWLYLMTDCVLFASLFATFAVLRGNTDGGPGGAELFDLPFVLVETVVLLVSSFLCGLAVLAWQQRQTRQAVWLLVLTGLSGLLFIGMEVYEFRHLLSEGAGWQRSGFLSAYFTLIATHGLHIVVGLIWLACLLVRMVKNGFHPGVSRSLGLFGMFWHFLDVIWIFIFSIVYLWGSRL